MGELTHGAAPHPRRRLHAQPRARHVHGQAFPPAAPGQGAREGGVHPPRLRRDHAEAMAAHAGADPEDGRRGTSNNR